MGGADETYAEYIQHTVRPLIATHYGEPTKRGLMGSSLGGLISFHIPHRSPSHYDFAASISGTMGWGSIGTGFMNQTMIERYAASGHQGTALYLDTGGSGNGCIDSDMDGIEDDDASSSDNYCENRQFEQVLLAAVYVVKVDMWHWWAPGAAQGLRPYRVLWANAPPYVKREDGRETCPVSPRPSRSRPLALPANDARLQMSVASPPCRSKPEGPPLLPVTPTHSLWQVPYQAFIVNKRSSSGHENGYQNRGVPSRARKRALCAQLFKGRRRVPQGAAVNCVQDQRRTVGEAKSSRPKPPKTNWQKRMTSACCSIATNSFGPWKRPTSPAVNRYGWKR
ncbi:MAG: hypothetical protein ACI841_004135 [Planctomycetota bacterium]|jgi:hypothetical protein